MKWFKTANVYTEKEEISMEYTADSIYKDAKEDFEYDINRDRYLTFKKEKDRELYFSYLNRFRMQKENDELRRVVHDKNGEFYGAFQKKFEETRNELETVKHHLELEQQAYQKLYMEKRELEAKLYAAGRELELRGYYGKDLT